MEMRNLRPIAYAIVLALSANGAHAGDTADELAAARAHETERELAKESQQVAAAEAVETVLADLKLDLDIHLADRTSERVVAGP